MSEQVGTRVWVVRNADDTTVYAYGFGTYVGDFPQPGWQPGPQERAMAEDTIRRSEERPIDLDAWFDRRIAEGRCTLAAKADAVARLAAERARPMGQRVDELLHQSSLNPKITLDSGGVVWGCECWWGEATDTTPAEWARGRRIVTVPAPHPAEAAP